MATTGAQTRRHRGLIALGTIIAIIVLLWAFWDWNWFKPLVEEQASNSLGRKVTIGNLDVRLATAPMVTADKIEIGDPPGFPADKRFGSIGKLAVAIDPFGLLHHTLSLTSVEIDDPYGDLAPGPNGERNWTFRQAGSAQAQSSMALMLGHIVVRNGVVHILDPRLKADFVLTIQTQAVTLNGARQAPNLVVLAKGTYNAQPITAKFVGGSVFSLQDSHKPYPVYLEAANGPTHVLLKGTVRDPLHFAGANLQLDLRGASLSDLYLLTGVPFQQSAPYHLTGALDYTPPKFRFRNMTGTVGNSDLSGEIDEDPAPDRPLVTANLHSKHVVLADLGGFIGATPGETETLTPGERTERAKLESSPKLLPDRPVNLPKLKGTDVDVTYRADRIEGKSVPLDNIFAHLVIRDGVVTVDPLRFGVGTGSIAASVRLEPTGDRLHALADVDFRQLDFQRIMASTSFKGAGTIGGRARIDGTGRSLAEIAGTGNGSLQLFMGGGNISALLVDLAGLDFGNSVLSAIGIPNKAQLHCLVSDFDLEQGVLKTKTLLLDTDEANVVGKGTVDLRDETLHYQISTDPKHFSVGALSAPIDITGPMKHPSIRPDPATVAARGGAAVALGIFLTPLGALIPTIQLGLGKDNDCQALIHQVRSDAARAAPPPQRVKRRHRGG